MYNALHVHYDKGSIGDSILKTEDAILRAKELGYKALAITDHGSMANVVDFYKTCNEHGIKPIIGLEAYETNNKEDKGEGYYHLVLLAINKQGYEDLLNISTDSHINGFYCKPRTDTNMLNKYGRNLIALSACLGGRLPKLVKENKLEEAVKTVEKYKQMFYDFYIEIQPGNFEEQIEVNKKLVYIASITNTKLVITNDVHYCTEEDWLYHDFHVKMAQKKNFDDPVIYPDKCYYLMDTEEIRKKFPYLEQSIVDEAIENTMLIAELIDSDNLYDEVIKMPVPKSVVGGISEYDHLSIVSTNKLIEISHTLKDPAVYSERLEYELSVLREVGYCGYMLVIKELYDYSRSNNIRLGPGRGSITGSLTAFLIGITEVDPVKYGLMFERFTSKYRKGSVPDIDIDCQKSERQKLFDYVVNTYGSECCALVSVFSIRKARSCLKDTARIFNIDKDTADFVSKLVPQVYFDDEDGEKMTDISIAEALEISNELVKYKEQYPQWFDAALKLEGIAKTTSIHASGTLISPLPLASYIPLIRNKDDSKLHATALSLVDSEKAGAIKYDFLGLATLDVIKFTNEAADSFLDLKLELSFQHPAVWDLIGSKNTTTLFQISSQTYKNRMFRLQPKTIEELAACLALIRGPCIASKLDEDYMQIVEGKKSVELIHPFYDKATANTNGILLYQEQLIETLVNFGFSNEEAFQIMKAAAKKKKDKLLKAEQKFRELGSMSSITSDVLDKIWTIILNMGLYSFNKSHAIAYALVCYESAYNKCYHTVEWMANSLTNSYMLGKNIQETVQECRRLGIKFLNLDINKSSWGFTVEDGAIRIGFCSVKGFGAIAYQTLDSFRPIQSMERCVETVAGKFNKKSYSLAIFGGAFDSMYVNQDRLDIFKFYSSLKDTEVLSEIKISKDFIFQTTSDLQTIETAIFETPIISNPVQYFDAFDYDNMNVGNVQSINAIVRRVKKITDKSGNKMAFLTLETSAGYLDSVVFASVYKGNTKFMKNNLILKIKVKKDKNGLIIQEFIA